MLTGKCGFGRDTSIAIGGTRDAPTVYVSFLDYNGDGRAKLALDVKVILIPPCIFH